MSVLAINHNSMAASAAGNLVLHSSRLSDSVRRLSSGLRINSAADDAAGLAIRELMRADIAALRQGVRNVNDAISMVQTFDGALSVIDEKLIRMKELAEQAATGTYDSTQRLMIDSEFQAMGSEIDRIARATDFNGIKMLNGEYSPTTTIRVQIGTKIDHVATATAATAANATTSNNGAAVNINSQNLAPAKYNGVLPTQPDGTVNGARNVVLTAAVKTGETVTEPKGGLNFDYNITAVDTVAMAPVSDDFSFVYNGPNNNTGAGTWSIMDKDGNELAANITATGPFVASTIFYNGRLTAITLNVLSYDGNNITDLNNLYDHGNTTGLTLSRNGTTYTR